jgi:flagellar biosynthesis component FlhA
MNNQTRFKLTLYAAAFLAVVTLLAIASKMETVATAAIAGIMTILSAYIWSQTQRPSQNEYTGKHSQKSHGSKTHRTSRTSGRNRTSVQK